MAMARTLVRWASTRKLALIVTTAVMAAAVFATLFQLACHYQSDGFLRAGRPLAEYNAHRASIEDRANLQRYLQSAGQIESPNGQFLMQAFSAAMIRRQVRAVMQYSKEDMKLFADQNGAGAANLLGFNISFSAATAEDAAERVRLMGEYLRDSLLRQDLLERIRENAGDAQAQQQKLQLKHIAKTLELDDAMSRLAALQTVAGKYPSASQFESRQLLSSDGGSARFLSPVMQLVGVESHIADLRIELATLERAIALNALRRGFYLKAESVARQDSSGAELFQAFQHLKAESLQGNEAEDDHLREVVSEVELLAGNLATKHLVKTSFASGPTVPGRRSGPPRVALALASLVGGTLLALACVACAGAVRGWRGAGQPRQPCAGAPAPHA